jgi:cyanophycinase-like exopeptidase
MPGVVCLQGGGEFSAGCSEMDAELLARAPGPVAVIALASPPGEAYRRTNTHGVSHFRRLGAEAFAVPDPRQVDLRDDTLAGVGLVVLPGGSPAGLLQGLATTGLAQALLAHVAAGGSVMGASAGAMVLGSWTLVPDDGFRVARGLGLAAGVVVVPHWDGARADWLKTLDAEVDIALVLGIPEESGILLDGGQLKALGRRPTHVVREGVEVGVGHTMVLP